MNPLAMEDLTAPQWGDSHTASPESQRGDLSKNQMGSGPLINRE